jgi:hypothetical protein
LKSDNEAENKEQGEKLHSLDDKDKDTDSKIEQLKDRDA